MKFLKGLIVFLCCFLIGGILFSAFVNELVLQTTKPFVLLENNIQDVDCILVLGAGVRDNKPSPMLQDRLDKSIELYFDGVSSKMLMSGDHGRIDYDEVNVMKRYALQRGIPSHDIFMDHAGFSTYESIYRAKEIFGASKIVIVSQAYHLPRAIFIARSLGLDAYGIPSEDIFYEGQQMREYREFLARNKDFLMSIFKPRPTYLGDTVPLFSNGDVTND